MQPKQEFSGEPLSPPEISENEKIYLEAIDYLMAEEAGLYERKEGLNDNEMAIERALLLLDPRVERLLGIMKERFYQSDLRNPFGKLPENTSFIFYSDLHAMCAEPGNMPSVSIPHGRNKPFPWIEAPLIGSALKKAWTEKKPERITQDRIAALQAIDRTSEQFGDNNSTVLIVDGGDRSSDGEKMSDTLNAILELSLGENPQIPHLHLAGNEDVAMYYEKWTWLLSDTVFGASTGYQEIGNHVMAYMDTNLLDQNWIGQIRTTVSEFRNYAEKMLSQGNQVKADECMLLAQKTEGALNLRIRQQAEIMEEVQDLDRQGKQIILLGHIPELMGTINRQLHNTTDAFFGHHHFSVGDDSPTLVKNIFQRSLGGNLSDKVISPHMAGGGVLGVHAVDFYRFHSTLTYFNPETENEKVINLTKEGEQMRELI